MQSSLLRGYQFSWLLPFSLQATRLAPMYSYAFSPPNPPLILHKIYFCKTNYYQYSPKIQIPFSSSVNSSAIVISEKNKNLGSYTRYRFRARCSLDPAKVKNVAEDENEEEISSKEIDAGLSNGGSSPSTSFLSVLCPLLKLFSAGDPSKERNYLLEEATSSLSTFARRPWGSRSQFDNLSGQHKVDPPLRLQLFEFEACPFCRRVREAITELDLSVEIYPCPKGSVRHREMVRKLGGREQFPFLVDPNTGISMYESSDIVKYLFQQYGEERTPTFGLLESTLVTGWVPTLLRAGRGMTFWEKSTKEPPPRKLELFSYENNPHARIAREALCELELPYILQSVGDGSIRAKQLLDMCGSKQVPYLVDPNTGTEIGDYKKIVEYLFQTYSFATS